MSKTLYYYIVFPFKVQDLAIVTAQKSQTPNSSIYDGEMKFVEDANENVKVHIYPYVSFIVFIK